jgi:hypothetical protein
VQILVRCPHCDAGLPVEAGATDAAGAGLAAVTIRCGRCQRDIPLGLTEDVRADRAVDRCPVCGGADFYTRKDFNPRVGVGVVVVGAFISAVFYWFGRDLMAYSILGLAVLVDLVVYGRLTEVTVCYRCHTEFRGKYQRSAPGFDLHTADVLEQEYERRIGRR